MKGNAQRGNQLVFGSLALRQWKNADNRRQIEALGQAVTRHMKREGQL